MNISVLKKIKYTSIMDLCKELAEFASNSNDSSSLPKLELFLIGDIILKGKIIDYQNNINQSHIWFQQTNNKEIDQITFIPIQNLKSISILELDHFLLLQEINTSSQKIKKFELRRRFIKIEKELSLLIEKNISISIENDSEISDRDRAIVNRILECLPVVFDNILYDKLSKNLVKKSINSIQFILNNNNSVQLYNGILSIGIEEQIKQTINKEIERLKKEIEALL